MNDANPVRHVSPNDTTARRRLPKSIGWVWVALAALAAAACDSKAPAEKCADPAVLRAEIRAELRAELLAELKADEPDTLDGLRPPTVRKLLGGEKLAINTALATKDVAEPVLTEPQIEHVPGPKSDNPDELTAEDQKALADDPAASPEKTPVMEWPTEDDGEKPAPTVRSKSAGHVDAKRPAGQIDPSILPPPASHKTPGPPVEPVEENRGDGDDDRAARDADKDDPARTVGIGQGGGDERGRTIRPGVVVSEPIDGLRVLDMAIAEKMQGKTPQRIADNFATPPPRLACYASYENRHKEVQITHIWRKGNKVLSRVELTVGVAAKWRTWSRQRTRDGNGEYSCEVLAPSGKRLGFARVSIGGQEATATP